MVVGMCVLMKCVWCVHAAASGPGEIWELAVGYVLGIDVVMVLAPCCTITDASGGRHERPGLRGRAKGPLSPSTYCDIVMTLVARMRVGSLECAHCSGSSVGRSVAVRYVLVRGVEYRYGRAGK